MNYAEATTNLVLAMSEEQQKAVHECLLMLFNLKQEKGEEKATNPTTKPKPEPLKYAYETNNTMRMIGRQNFLMYADNEEIRTGLQDITQARGYDLKYIFDLICDVFLYGVITGKRQERTKKKATNPTTK